MPILDVQKQIATERKGLLKKGMRTIKCLAYAASKTNSLRRRLQRPYLARRYQRLCSRQTQPSHQWLYGEDIAEEIRQQDQANKLGRGLTPRYGRNSGRRQNRNLNVTYPPPGRGRNQYQYQQPQYQQPPQYQYPPRYPGNLNYVMPSNYQSVGYMGHFNARQFVDDRNLPYMHYKPQYKNFVLDLNAQCSAILFSSSATAVQAQQSPAEPTATAQQKQAPWRPRQLGPDVQVPDRSVTPVSMDYVHSLGIQFTSFTEGGLEKKVKNWQALTSDPKILDLVRGIK